MFFLIICCCSVCDLSDLEFFVCLVFEGLGLDLFSYEQCMVAEHCFDVREIVQVFCLSAKKGFCLCHQWELMTAVHVVVDRYLSLKIFQVLESVAVFTLISLFLTIFSSSFSVFLFVFVFRFCCLCFVEILFSV